MPVKTYEKRLPVEAIQFIGTSQPHIDEIIDFVDLPISIDYTAEGVRLRVIRGAYDVIVARISDYIVKDSDGKLYAMQKADFEASYEVVTN